MKILLSILFTLLSLHSTSQLTVSAGADITINRKVGFVVLKGVVNQPTAVRTWRKLTAVAEEIGHILASTKDTTGATIFPYRNGAYQYELSATYLGNTVKDTVNVTVTYGTLPPQSSPAIRMVTAGDVITYPGMVIGDAIVAGANETVSPNPGFNIDVYVNNPVGISVGAGKSIWIRAGQYNVITLNFDSGQVVGTPANPVTIKNYGGQVEAVTLALKNLTHTKVTGLGDAAFRGHESGAYAFSQGKYGLYLNSSWQSISKSSLVLSGKWNSNVSFEYLEIGNGNFAGTFIKDDDNAANDYDSIYIQNCYLHDLHGEGNYIGTTGGGLKQMFNGLVFRNNRVLRSGNESFQFGKQNENNIVERNVFAFGAMNWRSTFERFNQAKAIQNGVQNGKNFFRSNLVRGSGDESFIAFSQSLNARYPTNNDTFHISNNLFDYAKGFIGGYIGGTAPVANMKINIANNLFARSIFLGDSIYTGTYGTNTMDAVRTQGGSYALLFKNNIRDNSKTNYNLTNTGSLDSSGNTVNASIPYPDFVNSGFPQTFDYNKFDMWTDSLFATWGNEYGAEGGTRVPYIVVYNSNDYVTFLSKIYKSKVNGNKGRMPIGVTDDYWELQTWTDGVITYDYPPDDYRLKAGDYYNLRGMGLTDNIPNNPTPPASTTSDILRGRKFRN